MDSAFIATIDFAGTELDVLMTEDKRLFIAVPQINRLTEFATPNNATKQLKRILGKESSLLQLKSDLNSQPVNCITLIEFEKVLARLDRLGNAKAQELRDAMVGLSLTQLSYDAFGVKFEAEERKAWLKQRQLHKKQFHPMLTKWLKVDGCDESKEYAIAVNKFKASANLPVKPVTEYSEDELTLLNNAEVAYNMARKLGHSHGDSLKYL